MNYSVEKQKGAVKVDFTLTADEWKEALSQAYLMTRGKYNIPGFRKGHAPRGVIESMYGKGVFFDDAFETSFRRAYGEVMDKETWIFPPLLLYSYKNPANMLRLAINFFQILLCLCHSHAA